MARNSVDPPCSESLSGTRNFSLIGVLPRYPRLRLPRSTKPFFLAPRVPRVVVGALGSLHGPTVKTSGTDLEVDCVISRLPTAPQSPGVRAGSVPGLDSNRSLACSTPNDSGHRK